MAISHQIHRELIAFDDYSCARPLNNNSCGTTWRISISYSPLPVVLKLPVIAPPLGLTGVTTVLTLSLNPGTGPGPGCPSPGGGSNLEVGGEFRAAWLVDISHASI